MRLHKDENYFIASQNSVLISGASNRLNIQSDPLNFENI